MRYAFKLVVNAFMVFSSLYCLSLIISLFTEYPSIKYGLATVIAGISAIIYDNDSGLFIK
jgi:hypothetical protein